MTVTHAPDATEQALYLAAARATLAPSLYNSQPWTFVVHPRQLDLYADQHRRATVIDPTGRQLAISCGAALFGVRVALAAAQLDVTTTLLPDPDKPDLLASVMVLGTTASRDAVAARLNAVADQRHSNRRHFTDDAVPQTVVDTLTHAAELEGAWLQQIRDLDDRVMLATLTQQAEAEQTADPAYRAELRSWTGDDPTLHDGVPASAIPRADGASHDDIPIRDFDTHCVGALPSETQSSIKQTLFVLGADENGLTDWLVAGQALGRVMLELTSAGFVCSILSQVVEIPSTRELLRRELRLGGQPHLLLRVGVAEATPATPRRPLVDVISSAPQADRGSST